MRKALAGVALTAALFGVGAAASPAMADPAPGGSFIFYGYHPSQASCDAAGRAAAPAHGPVYLCLNNGGTLWSLWVH
ncbi:hypothetical protein [Embleya sp. NBC_00896]|uniref:hypothetical protein n=1 Tax=Embleya sp. NBC_00896 TaxID=2975961 RepID=UPI00386CA850|nr:hypothetical protein OG928_06680 [Embleya sp. NBC_00896]